MPAGFSKLLYFGTEAVECIQTSNVAKHWQKKYVFGSSVKHWKLLRYSLLHFFETIRFAFRISEKKKRWWNIAALWEYIVDSSTTNIYIIYAQPWHQTVEFKAPLWVISSIQIVCFTGSKIEQTLALQKSVMPDTI